ncbi:MAG: hypothetical protein ACLQBQ_04450 [Smithella sp.]
MKTKKELIKKTPQKSTTYRPTVAEKRLLEVLLDPDHRLKSVTDICGVAKCDRHIYYTAFNKPAFVDYYTKESKALIKKAHSGIINASIRQALRGDAAHTKILLTMTGDYADRQVFPDKHGEPQQIAPPVSPDMPNMEAAARAAWLLGKALARKKEAEKKAVDEKK